MFEKRLGVVITIWKDSKKLQVVSTTIINGVGEVTRRKGRYSTAVKNPKEIITYQQHMGGVYRGDQHRLIGAGFETVAHFKKWYKKAFFCLANFSFFQGFTACNLASNRPYRPRRGENLKFVELKKWEFYSIAYE